MSTVTETPMFLFIFYPDDLPISESGVLMSLTFTVLGLTCGFESGGLCFMKLGGSIFKIVWVVPLMSMKQPYLSLLISKANFPETRIATPAC